jgi:hypothetical protein
VRGSGIGVRARLGGARGAGLGGIRVGRGASRSWSALILVALGLGAIAAALLAHDPPPPAGRADFVLPIEFQLPVTATATATPVAAGSEQVDAAPVDDEPAVEDAPAGGASSGEFPAQEAPADASGRRAGSSGATPPRPGVTAVRIPSVTRRSKYIHDHHIPLRWVWSLPWWPPAAVALGSSLWRLRRLRRVDGRFIPALVDAVVVAALIVPTMALAITIPDATGAPTQDAPIHVDRTVAGNGDIDILTTYHIHHFHPPVEIQVHYVLLALALGLVLGRRIELLQRTRRRRTRLVA